MGKRNERIGPFGSSRHRIRAVAVLLISCFIAAGVEAKDAESKLYSNCKMPPDAVRGEDGELKIFTSEELMERVRKTAPVERPLNLHKNNIFGTMIVDVVVDKNGRLSCIRPTAGHPLARAAVVQSLRKWVFKKYRTPTGTKTMIGVLAVPYDLR
jgi:hypothetical protein